MLSLALFLFFILLLGVTIASYTQRPLESVLPITCVFIIAFLFPFGLMGLMTIGIIVAVCVTIVLFVLTLSSALKSKENKCFIRNIFTEGMAWFVFSLIILSVGIIGKQFSQGDEFSHWGDVVKATVDLNGFSTNPNSLSAFQSYPPGMVIFQYLAEKIHIMLGGSFSEWRAYFAYNIFLLCFMAPVFSKLSIKKPISSAITIICILLLPTVFFTRTYYSLYIDVAISCVFGFGLYTIIRHKENDSYKLLSICSACFILPLLKDIGIFFAAALLLLYVFTEKKRIKKRNYATAVFSMIIPVVLWKINVKITNATEVFPFQFDLVELFRVLGGQGTAYKQTVLAGFPKALISKSFEIGTTGIKISYLVLSVIILASTFLSMKKYQTLTGDDRISASKTIIPLILLVYIIGLPLTYMFQFVEYEATRYASLERYIAIPICGICMFLLYLWTEILNYKNKGKICVILCIILLAAPLGNIQSLISREVVEQSREIRSRFTELDEKIERNISDQSTIYIISQEDNGGDFWIMHYLVRPNKIIIGQLTGFDGFSGGGYSIGKPYYEGDIWSSDITPEELMDQWIERYDYVAIVHTNDYLNRNYGFLFNSEITDNSLYYIDKDARIARLVE